MNHAADDMARLKEIDVLRGLAITAVVGLHATWFFLERADLASRAGKLVAYVHLLSGFGVPLFFLLSGLGMARRHPSAFTPSEYVRFILQRTRRLVPGYVFWSLLSLWILWPDRGRSWFATMRILLAGSADAHFYFIPLLFQVYLLWPLLRYARAFAAGGVLQAVFVSTLGAFIAAAWSRLSAYGVVPHTTVANLPLFAGYLLIGIAVGPHLETVLGSRFRRELGFFLCVAACGASAWTFDFFERSAPPGAGHEARVLAVMIFNTPATVYIYLITLGLLTASPSLSSTRVGGALSWLGQQAYGIYLVHLLTIRLLVHRLGPLGTVEADASASMLAKTIVTWGGGLIITALAVTLVSRVPTLARVVSNRP